MKINPFRKKANHYVEATQAKFNELSLELSVLQKDYDKAKADLDHEQAISQGLDDRASPLALQLTSGQREQRGIVAVVHRKAEIAKDKVNSLENKMEPLRPIIEAPKNFDDAQATLQNLLANRQRVNQEIAKLDASIGKLNKRATEVQAKIATETAAASAQMIATEDDFVVPESLTQLELQLKLANASLADLQRQRIVLVDELKDMPEKISAARSTFVHARAKLAEVDIYDQMLPLMKQLSRAAVTRYQTKSLCGRENKFEIDIPWDLIESTKSELAADLTD